MAHWRDIPVVQNIKQIMGDFTEQLAAYVSRTRADGHDNEANAARRQSLITSMRLLYEPINPRAVVLKELFSLTLEETGLLSETLIKAMKEHLDGHAVYRQMTDKFFVFLRAVRRHVVEPERGTGQAVDDAQQAIIAMPREAIGDAFEDQLMIVWKAYGRTASRVRALMAEAVNSAPR